MLALRRLALRRLAHVTTISATRVRASSSSSEFSAIDAAFQTWKAGKGTAEQLLRTVRITNLQDYIKARTKIKTRSRETKEVCIRAIESHWKKDAPELSEQPTFAIEDFPIHQFGIRTAENGKPVSILSIKRLFDSGQLREYLDHVDPEVDRRYKIKDDLIRDVIKYWEYTIPNMRSEEQQQTVFDDLERWKLSNTSTLDHRKVRIAKAYVRSDLLAYIKQQSPQAAKELESRFATKHDMVDWIMEHWGEAVLKSSDGVCRAVEAFKPARAVSPLSLTDSITVEHDLSQNFDSATLSSYIQAKYDPQHSARKMRKEESIKLILSEWEKTYPPRSSSPFHNIAAASAPRRHFATQAAQPGLPLTAYALLLQHRAFTTVSTTPASSTDLETYAPTQPLTLQQAIDLAKRLNTEVTGVELAEHLKNAFSIRFSPKRRKTYGIHLLLDSWHQQRFETPAPIPAFDEFDRLVVDDRSNSQTLLKQRVPYTVLDSSEIGKLRDELRRKYLRGDIAQLMKERYAIVYSKHTSKVHIIEDLCQRLAMPDKSLPADKPSATGSDRELLATSPLLAKASPSSSTDAVVASLAATAKRAHSSPSAPTRNLLMFAEESEAASDSTAASPVDAVETLKPPRVVVTELEFKQLQRQLDVSFMRANLLKYIQSAFPTALVGERVSDITKPFLIHIILVKCWGLQIAEHKIAGLRDIADHENTTFSLECRDRDMFFIHGYGETQRRLMFECNVNISFDKESRSVVITGQGRSIKKAILAIRQLLNYVEAEMTVPPQTLVQYSRHGMFTTIVKKLMKQCNVFITAAGSEKIVITATNLVNLTRAKKLIRRLWDKFQDNQIHVTACVARSEDGPYTFLPKVDLLARDPYVEQIALWRIGAVQVSDKRQRRNEGSSRSEEPGEAKLQSSIVRVHQPYTQGVNAVPQNRAPVHDSLADMATTRFVLKHYATQEGLYLPECSLRTRLGTTSYFTDKDVMRANIFSAPKPEGFPVSELAAWFTTEQPETVFDPVHTPLPAQLITSAPVTFWRIVYSQDRWASLGDPTPGKPDIEVRCTVTAAGAIHVQSVRQEKRALCVDVNDLDRVLTARTEVTVDQVADGILQRHILDRIVPYFAYQHQSSHLFAPPSFLFHGAHKDTDSSSGSKTPVEYTLKSIALVAERTERLPTSHLADLALVHRETVSTDGVTFRETELVASKVYVNQVANDSQSWDEYANGLGELLRRWTVSTKPAETSHALDVIGLY
ncbi:hypothetical protein RI367_006479 [Sorochytrium milnesiophthora]